MPMKKPAAAAAAAATNRIDNNQGVPQPPPRNLAPHHSEAPGNLAVAPDPAVELPTSKDQADSVAPSQQQTPSAPVLQPPMRQHASDPSYAELPSFKDQVQQVDPPADNAKPAAVNQSNSPAAQMQQQQQQQPPPQQQLETDASFVPLAQGIPVSLDHDLAAAQPPPLQQPEGTHVLKKHIVWGMVVLGLAIVVAVAAVVGSLLSSNSNGSAPATVQSPSISTPEPTTDDNTNQGIPALEVAKLTASDGAARDLFGYSVAINGDTIVIGAYWDNTGNGIESGSAHVYTRSGTAWTKQAKLTASDGTEYDDFGYSVAINGDTIVIGAFFDDTENGVDSGSAYVYTRSGTVWTEQAKLTASDGAAFDYFGTSVAINGDTLAIGAFRDDTENGSNSGSAYVYTLSGTVWTEQAKLTASDGAEGDWFGRSVAINGNTLVIGAYQDDTEKGENSGSAYIFE